MTLSITLTPDLEARLKRRAVARGFTEIADYAKKIIEDDVNQTRTLDEIFAPFREHTENFSEDEIGGLVKRARIDVCAQKKLG